MDEKQELQEKVHEQVEQKLKDILNEGISKDNVDYLFKLTDIHKDICNEKYWEEKIMRYRTNYDNYGIDRSYGRRERDSRGRYRGEDAMNDMYHNYQNYQDSRDSYGRGNYSAKEDTMQSLEYMLKSVVEFVKMLEQDAGSQEEVDMIKRYTKQLSER